MVILGTAWWQENATAQLTNKLSHCGRSVTFYHPVALLTPECISIGDDVAINAFVHIWGDGGVTIGDRVMIATHVAITSATHDYKEAVMRSTVVRKPVRIEDDVWIGSNAVIMPGVTLGAGCVIGAGAVVTRNVPAGAIAVGIPARVVGQRP